MAQRDYQNKYPSVTTVLGVLRKVGLEFWYKNNTLAFINEAMKKGKEAGTDTHDVIHFFIETGQAKLETKYLEEVTYALKSFMLFRKENPDIKLENSEVALTSEIYQFNGTLDCKGNKNNIPAIGDWKSRLAKDKLKPDIYDEDKIQVSTYVKLWNEVKNDTIENAFVVALAKDKIAYNLCELNKEEIDVCFNDIFLHALQIYNAQKKLTQLRKEQ